MSEVLTIYGFDLLAFISDIAKPIAIIVVIGLVIWAGTQENRVSPNTRRRR